LFLWSGGSGTTASGPAIAGGATYDVATETWTPMDTTNAPTVRARASVVWTGNEAIVWGGSNNASGDKYYADGAVYRP
jgi:N-acetylneuraminic acid mutarotase